MAHDWSQYAYPSTQVHQEADEAVNWLWDPLIFRGGVTSIVGKPKEAGKTTFMMALALAIARGQPFCGRPTVQAPVLYLTEQTSAVWKRQFTEAGGPDPNVHVMLRPQVRKAAFEQIVEACDVLIPREGFGLVVLDTFAPWAKLNDEEENHSAPILTAVGELRGLCEDHGCAVCCLRHMRKSGGSVADAGRGSNAFEGEMDCLCTMAPYKGSGPHRRLLRVQSRFVMSDLKIEWGQGGQFTMVESDLDPSQAKPNRPWQFFATFPRFSDKALTIKQAAGATDTPIPTAHRYAKRMVQERLISEARMPDESGALRYHQTQLIDEDLFNTVWKSKPSIRT